MNAPLISKAQAVSLIAELFREYGYHGTSYSQITKATGLGKGSLYHYFPKGKQDVAQAVLADIHHWFTQNIFCPLEEDSQQGLAIMLRQVEAYFHSGRRICLLGAFALYDARTTFEKEVSGYFACWADALSHYFQANGMTPEQGRPLAMAMLAQIQGGLVMAQALKNPALFMQALEQCRVWAFDAVNNVPDGL